MEGHKGKMGEKGKGTKRNAGTREEGKGNNGATRCRHKCKKGKEGRATTGMWGGTRGVVGWGTMGWGR